MRVNDFYNIIEVIKQDILSSPEEYLKLLKVMGNNQRYDFLSQMTIYDKNTEATACGKFDFWRKRFNRTVKYREKGIPIIEDYGGYKRVDYIFDVSQTVSRNREVNEVNLWQFDKEKYDFILEELIENAGYDSSDKLSENLYNLTRIASEERAYSLANEIRVDDGDRSSFVAFINQSISYAVANRFNEDFPINRELIADNYHHLDSTSFITVGNVLSELSEDVIEKVMVRTRDLELQEELANTRETKGGRENVVRRDSNDARQTERICEYGDDGRDSFESQGKYPGQAGGREGVYGNLSESDLRHNEAGLSSRDGESEPVRDVTGSLREERTGESFDADTERSDSDDTRRETQDDGGLEDRGRELQGNEDYDVGLEGDSYQGSSGSLEENSKDLEEAEEASFFYSKNEPSILMTEEMLERVPKIYEQDGVALADKEVHAAYFIPFRSNWTWYMTEFDPETRDAYGLVLGYEPEWGYFNLDELEELQAQRLILEDFPKTFRELADTELRKQLSADELNSVFRGQLSFENEPMEQVSLFDGLDLEEESDKNSDRLDNLLEIGQTVYYDYEAYLVEEIYTEGNQGHLKLKPTRETSHYNPHLTFESKDELYELIALERPIFIVGDEVHYKDKDFAITNIDMSSNLKTVTIRDHDEFLGGMIRASEVLVFKNEEELNKMFQSLGKETLEEPTDEASVDSDQVTKAEEIPAKNYVLPEVSNELTSLTPSERLSRNIEALQVLFNIESENRNAREDEQEVLSSYLGWGGLADVFDENKKGQWEEARSFLKENLTNEEYERAKESTLTSFYTPKIVVDSIYQTLSDMGFRKGNILEPSMGVGNFIGSLPSNLSESKFYGVELDSISGRIAKKLYPESDIQIKGLEETDFSNNFFDIAIGNVPFGDYKVNDRDYNRNNFLIHDYFFAKSIDKVRNGGIIAYITSSGTMDKKDESVRRYLGARAEFLGAIRLPNNTFKGEAGTEVTSDIIFLKKRDSILDRDDDWIHLAEDENGLTYNKYFVDHPEMMLGQMVETSGRFGNEINCIAGDEDLATLLRKASKEISVNNRYEEKIGRAHV